MPSLTIKGRLEDGQGRVYCLWCLGQIEKPRRVSEFCGPACRSRWNREIRRLAAAKGLVAGRVKLERAIRKNRRLCPQCGKSRAQCLCALDKASQDSQQSRPQRRGDAAGGADVYPHYGDKRSAEER